MACTQNIAQEVLFLSLCLSPYLRYLIMGLKRLVLLAMTMIIQLGLAAVAPTNIALIPPTWSPST